MVTTFDRDTKPRVGLCQRHRLQARADDADSCFGDCCGGFDQIGAGLVGFSLLNHSSSDGPRVCQNPRALGGLQLAYQFDTPTGPTIVALAAVLFALANIAKPLRQNFGLL